MSLLIYVFFQSSCNFETFLSTTGATVPWFLQPWWCWWWFRPVFQANKAQAEENNNFPFTQEHSIVDAQHCPWANIALTLLHSYARKVICYE